MKNVTKEESQVLLAADSTLVCTGKDPIGGKGRRKAKRSAKKSGNCPMCNDPSCKLSLNDFLKSK